MGGSWELKAAGGQANCGIVKAQSASAVSRLEELPNIGKSIARDLRSIGIGTPRELAGRSPLGVFRELCAVMGKRHDPCVLHTLLAVEHFYRTSEALPWWQFAQQGKRLLRENR
jgi:hypothetical protein